MSDKLQASTERHPAITLVREGMTTYGTYVIESRAIPDIRDGLKPVQRRVLYTMFTLGLSPSKPHQKSANTVGECLAKFHPHGDTSCYSSMVNMVKPFKWHYPAVDGHGNFGDHDMDAAAYRYTEARLSKFAWFSLFDDICAAQMVRNYDGRTQEPLVLPAKLPISLLNGSQGIAVGISSSIPPHNMKEIAKALVALVSNPSMSTKALMKRVQGPDYGFGVCTSPYDDIYSLYDTGRGTLSFRCAYHFEAHKADKNLRLLVITSLSPGFVLTGGKKKVKTSFMSRCAELQEKNIIDFVADESSDKIRIVVGFRDTQLMVDEVLPMLDTRQSFQLYGVTRDGSEQTDETETTVKHYSLRGMLLDFIEFRREVEDAKLLIEKKQQEDHLEREQAILSAIDNIDKIMQLQKKAKDAESFISSLKTALKITRRQAEIIANAALVRFIRGNREEQQTKISEIQKRLKEIKHDLAHLDDVLIRTFNDVSKRFSDDRKMEMTDVRPRLPRVDSSMYISFDNKGVLERFDEPPTRVRREFLNFVSSSATAAIVRADASVRMMKPTQIGRMTIKDGAALASLPLGESKLVLANYEGELAVVEPTKSGDFNAAKMKADLAVGIGKGESLLIAVDTKAQITHHLIPYNDLAVKRRNSAPSRFVKRGAGEIIGLHRVSQDSKIVSGSGADIKWEGKKPRNEAIPVFVLGENNLLQFEDGSKEMCGMKEAIARIKSGKVQQVFQLQ